MGHVAGATPRKDEEMGPPDGIQGLAQLSARGRGEVLDPGGVHEDHV